MNTGGVELFNNVFDFCHVLKTAQNLLTCSGWFRSRQMCHTIVVKVQSLLCRLMISTACLCLTGNNSLWSIFEECILKRGSPSIEKVEHWEWEH